jgi:transcriptional regulator
MDGVLIHPWDAALDDAEWQGFLADGHDFGQLIAAGRDRDVPVVVPTHFLPAGEGTVLAHCARPNPVWAAIEENPTVLLAVVGDYAYVPTTWNADPGQPVEHGVPTSYYAAVQLTCRAEIVDDPAAKATLLTRQLAHFQPEGGHAEVCPDAGPYARLLPGIRGLVLTVLDARAKFKYGGNKTVEHRYAIADRLAARDAPLDRPAREHLIRRMEDHVSPSRSPSSSR